MTQIMYNLDAGGVARQNGTSHFRTGFQQGWARELSLQAIPNTHIKVSQVVFHEQQQPIQHTRRLGGGRKTFKSTACNIYKTQTTLHPAAG